MNAVGAFAHTEHVRLWPFTRRLGSVFHSIDSVRSIVRRSPIIKIIFWFEPKKHSAFFLLRLMQLWMLSLLHLHRLVAGHSVQSAAREPASLFYYLILPLTCARRSKDTYTKRQTPNTSSKYALRYTNNVPRSTYTYTFNKFRHDVARWCTYLN